MPEDVILLSFVWLGPYLPAHTSFMPDLCSDVY
jgi:hypothetical protein